MKRKQSLAKRSLKAADAFIPRARIDVAPNRASACHTCYQLGFQAGYRARRSEDRK